MWPTDAEASCESAVNAWRKLRVRVLVAFEGMKVVASPLQVWHDEAKLAGHPMNMQTCVKEVTLQVLREAIASGTRGDYSCPYDSSGDLGTWSRQARELDQFAQGRGYVSRAHPTATGANLVDLLVVRI